MKFPKTINRYCPNCRHHTTHSVSIYKKSKERKLNQGRRRVDRKKKGYGSFPKEIFHKNAKINKKTLPILECTECGKKHYGKAYRVKKFELQEV
ncbi:MAG: 50S ribosomal protein L44e [Candidatus Lokiarchaeota archaeon]|nr:50S ribosomal protein L44e [Candidatus Lokiarchaeota archaeon]